MIYTLIINLMETMSLYVDRSGDVFTAVPGPCVYLCWPCSGRSWRSVGTRLEEGSRPEDEMNTWTQSHLWEEERRHVDILFCSLKTAFDLIDS